MRTKETPFTQGVTRSVRGLLNGQSGTALRSDSDGNDASMPDERLNKESARTHLSPKCEFWLTPDKWTNLH